MTISTVGCLCWCKVFLLCQTRERNQPDRPEPFLNFQINITVCAFVNTKSCVKLKCFCRVISQHLAHSSRFSLESQTSEKNRGLYKKIITFRVLPRGHLRWRWGLFLVGLERRLNFWLSIISSSHKAFVTSSLQWPWSHPGGGSGGASIAPQTRGSGSRFGSQVWGSSAGTWTCLPGPGWWNKPCLDCPHSQAQGKSSTRERNTTKAFWYVPYRVCLIFC